VFGAAQGWCWAALPFVNGGQERKPVPHKSNLLQWPQLRKGNAFPGWMENTGLQSQFTELPILVKKMHKAQ